MTLYASPLESDADWAAALSAPTEPPGGRTADHLEHRRTPWAGVFTEVRHASYTRTCVNGCRIATSDPELSVRVAPWAGAGSDGRWTVTRFCEACGRQRSGGLLH